MEVLKRVAALLILLLLTLIQLILKIIIIVFTKVNANINIILRKLKKVLRTKSKVNCNSQNIKLGASNV